jgi:hypothetical protein
MSPQREVISGIFFDRPAAEDALVQLRRIGYADAEISVIMSDQTRDREFGDVDDHHENMAVEGATSGAIIGGGLGAIIAGLTATGSILAIAGSAGALTPLVAGPLAAALAGLGAGGVAGGIIGALVGTGVPREHASAYAEGITRGGIIIVVPARGSTNDTHARRVLGTASGRPTIAENEEPDLVESDEFARASHPRSTPPASR